MQLSQYATSKIWENFEINKMPLMNKLQLSGFNRAGHSRQRDNVV